jgi:hypothetical protein
VSLVSLDDSFFDHPKAIEAGEDGANLFVRGLAYCRRYNTGGRIPKGALSRLSTKRDAPKHATDCVRVGLWIEDETSWHVHDYEQWYTNDPETKLAKSRALAASRSKKYRGAKSDKERDRAALVASPSRDASQDRHVRSRPVPNGLTTTGQSSGEFVAAHNEPARAQSDKSLIDNPSDETTKENINSSRDGDATSRVTFPRASTRASPYSDSDSDNDRGRRGASLSKTTHRSLCPSRDRLNRLDETEVGNAFIRGGGNAVDYRCPAALKLAFIDALTEMRVSLADCETMAAFLAAGGASWSGRKTFDVGWLIRENGARLTELFAKSAEWQRERDQRRLDASPPPSPDAETVAANIATKAQLREMAQRIQHERELIGTTEVADG